MYTLRTSKISISDSSMISNSDMQKSSMPRDTHQIGATPFKPIFTKLQQGLAYSSTGVWCRSSIPMHEALICSISAVVRHHRVLCIKAQPSDRALHGCRLLLNMNMSTTLCFDSVAARRGPRVLDVTQEYGGSARRNFSHIRPPFQLSRLRRP